MSLYKCIYVYIYIHIYILLLYTHTHIYIYIYIYILYIYTPFVWKLSCIIRYIAKPMFYYLSDQKP